MSNYIPHITYSKKKKFISKRYTIYFPDDAVVETNVDGLMGSDRDFVAYLSEYDDDPWEQAPISFAAAGQSHHTDGNDITADKAYQHCVGMIDIFAATTGDEAEAFRYSNGAVKGAMVQQKISDKCSNFHIWVGEDGHMFQFRVIFNVRMLDTEMRRIVNEWLDTMEWHSVAPKSTTKTAPALSIEEKNKQTEKWIFDLLRNGESMTIIEMQNALFLLNDLSNQHMSAICARMEEKGVLSRAIIKKKSYFSLSEDARIKLGIKAQELEQQISDARNDLATAQTSFAKAEERYNSLPDLEKKLDDTKTQYSSILEPAIEKTAQAKKRYDECKTQKDKTNAELESLGFFAFGKKKAAKAKLQELQDEASVLNGALQAAQNEQEQIEQKKKSEVKALEKQIADIRSEYTQARQAVDTAKKQLDILEKEKADIPSSDEIDLPDYLFTKDNSISGAEYKKHKENDERYTDKQIENAIIKMMIDSDKALTISEINDSTAFLKRISSMRLSNVCRNLVNEGLLEKTIVRKKSYFALTVIPDEYL